MMLLTTFSLFFRFMQRDLYLYKNRIIQYVVNYAVIYPTIHALAFGYLQSNAYFGSNASDMGTILFTGNFLIVIIILTYKLSIELLFDLEGDRSIDFQITILNPRLLIIQKIIFSTLFSSIILLPYFPIAKLLLGHLFVSANTVWPYLLCIQIASCLLCSVYNHLIACLLPDSNSIGFFWRRINTPLVTILGGFWIPWYALRNFSPMLGILTLANPFIYITEGIRQSILQSDRFLSFGVCLSMLLLFSLILTLWTFYAFKKRLDHI